MTNSWFGLTQFSCLMESKMVWLISCSLQWNDYLIYWCLRTTQCFKSFITIAFQGIIKDCDIFWSETFLLTSDTWKNRRRWASRVLVNLAKKLLVFNMFLLRPYTSNRAISQTKCLSCSHNLKHLTKWVNCLSCHQVGDCHYHPFLPWQIFHNPLRKNSFLLKLMWLHSSLPRFYDS